MRAWLLSLIAIVGSGCQPSSSVAPAAREEAISGGAPDDQDPAVVAILFRDGIICSGTLVSPTVILTAGHCLYGAAPDSVLFGASMDDPAATLVNVADVRLYPLFQYGVLRDDIGLIRLESASSTTPVAVWDRPLDDGFQGGSVRIVGFGHASADGSWDLQKRTGVARVDTLSADTFQIAADPSSPCNGDSGGPAFAVIDGSEQLVGVTSAGGETCTEGSRDARADRYSSFIKAYTAQATARSMERCYFNDNCASQICVIPPDAPDFGYCSTACSNTLECPAGTLCTEGTGARVCQYARLAPGAIGAPCVDDIDCEDHICAAREDQSARTCGKLCFPTEVGGCPASDSCIAAPERKVSLCTPPAAHGCSVAGASPADTILAIVVPMMLLIRRRKRLTR